MARKTLGGAHSKANGPAGITAGRPDTEDKLRRLVAGRLRLKGCKFPDAIWKTLKAGRYVADALDEVEGIEHLVDRARLLLLKKRVRNQGKPRAQAVTELGPVPLELAVDPRDERRAEVQSRELARLALAYGGYGRDEDGRPWKPLVLKFRDDFLGGGVITEREAEAFLDSPAIRLLRPSEFRGSGIPFVGHRAEQARIKSRFADHLIFYEFPVTIRWGERSKTLNIQRIARNSLEELLVPGTVEWFRVSTLTETVFANLFSLSQRLAKAYVWPIPQAAKFVLTGTPPRVPCIDARRWIPEQPTLDHQTERLELRLYPWLSASTLLKMYRQYQQEILGRENRSPRLDRLDLLDFVSERRHDGRPWREILLDWNRSHPEFSYDSDAIRNFRRDFDQIYKLVIGTGIYGDMPREYRYEPGDNAEGRAPRPTPALSSGPRRGKTKSARSKSGRAKT